jgi:protein phosphatase
MNTKHLTDTDEYPAPVPPWNPGQVHASFEVDVGAATHPGQVRPNNEDHYLVIRGGRFLQTLLTNLPQGSVPGTFGDTIHAAAVADGMGGRASGEVASRLAITHLLDLVLATPDWIFGLGTVEVEKILRRATERMRGIHAELVERAQQDPALAGMGTTLTVAWNFRTALFLAHVGDSRAYLLRAGALKKLTRDHTVAQGLADAGMITGQEVATHWLRHVLTQALGIPDSGHKSHVQRLDLVDGDRLLLCTDGLTDMVDEATIAATLGRDARAAEKSQALVDQALAAGGRDNVTAVVFGYRFAPGT